MKKIIVLAASLSAVACARNPSATNATAGTSTTREDSTASAASGTGHGGAHGTAGATGSHAAGTMAGSTETTGTGMETGSGTMAAEGGVPMMEFSTKEEFLAHLQHVNEMEIQAGQMAQKNTTNPKVKQYGVTLVTDHQKAQTRIKPMMTGTQPVAGKSGDHAAMMEQKMSRMQEMKALKGVEFDRQFLTQMVADHDETIQAMKSFQSKTDDAKVKSLITELLPTIESHRKTAQTLLASVDRQNTSGQ